MGKRKQRIRSPHPGVKLKLRKRANGDVWLARWVDPDTGKEKDISLTHLGKTTEESRRDWAIDKSESLRARMAAIASGAALHTETHLKAAVEDFYKERKSQLASSTLVIYRQATTPFTDWCAKSGVMLTESLTTPKLAQFRAHFVARPAHAQARGEARGKRKEGKRKRSAGQINKCIRALRTVLNHWRRLGLTPSLDSDAIRDSLTFVRAQKPLPQFLKAKECVALVVAALRHDAETFALTRQENAGEGKPGTTPRYAPIAGFVVLGLLSGMRFGELANLRWRDIDLDAGEISLQSDRTKTGHGRVVGLRESPAAAALLVQMKLRAGGALYVWGNEPYRRDLAESARKRLVAEYGAPEFTWHDLRRTCGTFLTCAPAIYGAASAFMSAKRLGHSVMVSERHYAGNVSNIPATATTLEAAMGISECLEKFLGSDFQVRRSQSTAMSA